MSRIGNAPVEIPSGVTVKVAEDNLVSVKGPKGELSRQIHPEMKVTVEGNVLKVTRPSDDKPHRSLHGLSHPVIVEPPKGIEFDVPNANAITVKGIDKEVVGQVAAEIRSFREPEPYKGKGIKYAGEHIRRKEGKAGAKGKK